MAEIGARRRRLPDHGLAAWELVKERGYEGQGRAFPIPARPERDLAQGQGAQASPFHDPPEARRVTWLESRAKVAVRYNEGMEGRLRDPVFRGIAVP
jgi:hypothetical protein